MHMELKFVSSFYLNHSTCSITMAKYKSNKTIFNIIWSVIACLQTNFLSSKQGNAEEGKRPVHIHETK